RVVAPLGRELGRLARAVDRLLRLADRRRRLEGDADDDRLARGDPAERPAGAVRRRPHVAPGISGHERVVVLAALEERAREAAADLEALARGEREHGFGEIGL